MILYLPYVRESNLSLEHLLSYEFKLCNSLSLQALGIPFIVLSASDLKAKCRDFCQANLEGQAPLHWFRSMRDQIEQKACTVHPYATECKACSTRPSLGVIGAPCHPFSTARTTRYQAGSVESHREYAATMLDVVDLLAQNEPPIVISEQVEGFDKPYEKGGSTTPKQEFLFCIAK